VDAREEHVYQTLDQLGIGYVRYEHQPVHTADEALTHWAAIPAVGCKNLFLRNKKGNRHYLVVLEVSRQADLRRLAALVGDDRLSFGSADRLARQLGLSPGAVSPLGLVNNTDKTLQVIVDGSLREAAALIFHPNVNTASVTISGADLERFLAWSGNPVRWIAPAVFLRT
jgi:Ala-tRNA(Pro) deacylase